MTDLGQTRTSRPSCRISAPPPHNGHGNAPARRPLSSNGGHESADLELASHQRANCDGFYERPADAFLSGSMSDCAEKGFLRNPTHPESSAALRTAGSSFPVM